MKNKKLNLEELKLKSFVTQTSEVNVDTIKGGSGQHICSITTINTHPIICWNGCSDGINCCDKH